MKISMSLRLRALLFLAACMTVAQARAADAYHEFVADIYLLQSQQTRNPDTVIAYGDGKSGALLKSVLAPEKFGPQLEHYFKLSTRGQDKTLPNLLHAIKPVIDRYDAAFKVNPKKYEAEGRRAVSKPASSRKRTVTPVMTGQMRASNTMYQSITIETNDPRRPNSASRCFFIAWRIPRVQR